MRQDRHELWTGPDMFVDWIVVFAVHASVDGMDQPVALAAAGMLEERATHEPLARGREDDIHRVVHTAGHYALDSGAVRASAKDVTGAGDEVRLAALLIGLLGEGAFAPVEPTVAAKVRPVKIVGAAGQRFAVDCNDLWPAVEDGKLSLPIDKTFPLDKVADALAMMKANQHFGKIVLTM